MKRFLIDFIIAFMIVIIIFGMSGNNVNNEYNNNFDNEIVNKDDNIENIKDYDGNLINRISFKINNIIQNVADFGFDIFKGIMKSFLE